MTDANNQRRRWLELEGIGQYQGDGVREILCGTCLGEQDPQPAGGLVDGTKKIARSREKTRGLMPVRPLLGATNVVSLCNRKVKKRRCLAAMAAHARRGF